MGVHIYKHPMPREGNTTLGHLFEYGCALFWEILFTWWIYFRHGFQVIKGCNPPDTIFLIALPFKLLGVKYIFDHHDACPELYLAKYGRKRVLYSLLVWLEKMTYRFSDVVMATNSSYRDLAVTRGGVDPNDVFIVRNGPDLQTFKPVPPNPALKCGKPYLIGYVGTMNVQDGLDILLDVALQIKTLGRRDIQFRLVGKGPGLPGLRKMSHDKGLDDMVEVHWKDFRRAIVGDSVNSGYMRQSGQAVPNERYFHDDQNHGIHGLGKAHRSVRIERG